MHSNYYIPDSVIAKAWRDPQFWRELKANPKLVVEKEMGYSLPKNMEVEVLAETPSKLYVVLPYQPEFMEEILPEKTLESIAGIVNVGDTGSDSAGDTCTNTNCCGCT